MPTVVRMAIVEAPSSSRTASSALDIVAGADARLDLPQCAKCRAGKRNQQRPESPPISRRDCPDAGWHSTATRDHVVLRVAGQRHALGGEHRPQLGECARQTRRAGCGSSMRRPLARLVHHAECAGRGWRSALSSVLLREAARAIVAFDDRRLSRSTRRQEAAMPAAVASEECPPAVVVRARMRLRTVPPA